MRHSLILSIFLSIFFASAPTAFAQSGADVTPLITDASQFVAGGGADAASLIDGNPATVWTSPGTSLTVKLPQGLTNNTPFRVRFTIPAGAEDVPSAFAIYGLHDNNGTMMSETDFGHTNARIDYNGNVVYESPTFYVRDEFRDQWWYCTHLRFVCTEIMSETAAHFRLAEFQIVLYDEYQITTGAMLRKEDFINAVENNIGDSWYSPLVDEKETSCWNAADNEWVWQNHNDVHTGFIITPRTVEGETEYSLEIGRPSASLTLSNGQPASQGFPTDLRWSYQTAPGGSWTVAGNLDLSGVQPGEIYKTTFVVRPEYYRIKFETMDNAGNQLISGWAGGCPNTVLSHFQLYGPVKSYAQPPSTLPPLGVQYPDPNKVQLNQNFFHNRLYSSVLADFTFEHTHGIVDQSFDNNFHSDGGWLTNLDIWDADGHLKAGVEIPGADDGVALPDFSYEAPINSSEVRPEGDFKRQPTTTIYHEVYAIPGERVDLIPYSDIWHCSYYNEDFYRFYDYMTDEAHPDVYFLYTPRKGAYSKNGIFGGRALNYVFDDRDYGNFDWGTNDGSLRGPGGVASFYRPKVTDNDPYIDEYVAADYSQYYYSNGSFTSNEESRREDVRRFIDTENRIIHEPIINFRHVFHVVDGRKFADESSKDVASNEEFLAQQLNLFYARANEDFKIRIINPMPETDGMHSNRYYKKSDGTYERMGTYEIQTYKYDGYVRGEKVENMFVPDEDSHFYTVDTELETELNPGMESTNAWIEPNEKFYRALRCDAENAHEGTYLIRLVAKTREGERIYLDGGDPEGMSLRDIIITFLDKEHASFELEENIPHEHSEAYLDKNFQTKSSVDFDKYMALSGNPDFMEKSASGEGERIKYPVPWMNSEYAFGYKYAQDFSTYTIASHTDCVPYAQATTSKWDKHDRLYKNTNGEQQGFFYYANAAGDPGVMARVDIPSVCIGSTIHVSAWINSMGVYMDNLYEENEPANVNFDLVAIMKDGREVNINNFSTGYVPNDPEHCGKWMHAYYSVTPDFSVIDRGNFNVRDVDHFQVVLVNNSVNSNGADYAIDDIRIYVSKPVVMATQLKPLCQGETVMSQRIDMPFHNLVSSVGGTVADGNEPGEDVTVYYAVFDKEKYESLAALHGGFTREVFDGSAVRILSADGSAGWSAMTFNTNYANHIPWDKDNAENVASRLTVDGIDCISYNVLLEDGGLHGGKRYIAALCIPDGGDLPDWSDFDISDNCTKQAEFEVTGSTVVKVDGIVKADASDLEICENQFPVIQVDIYGIEAVTGDVRVVDRTPLVDWFKGSLESLAACRHNDIALDEALLNFRHIWPEATSLDCEYTTKDGFRYDERYRETIQHFIDEGRLELASHSFLSDAVRIPEGEESVQYSIVVIPANRQEDREIDGRLYTICNDPTELCVNVARRAPGLLNGFENVDYPESMTDVPLRAGLAQLEKTLHMPLRSLYIVTPGCTALRPGEDTGLYLVKTDDPQFRDLETEPGADENGTGLRSVGEVLSLKAERGAPAECNASIRFADTGFKEGYRYTVRFDYAEDNAAGVASEAMCDGQAIFTVKVVAEYQMWTGEADASSNFNNDLNWRRVSYDELQGQSAPAELVTDGSNDRTFSFSPLAFTKVIVPAGEEYPWLFAPGHSQAWDVFDGKSHISVSFATGLSDNDAAGAATKNIAYDLTAREDEGELYCRTWEANTCAQIHFLPNAEIAGQQHLLYETAWVDIEMEPQRWYTAASPLQATVAGDMYLPSATARQNTELFLPVAFDKALNDRFNPAVYQRGWDKGTARVFELPSESAGEVRNVTVSLDWSDVYNDVTELYSPGTGFSVKTDISALTGEKPEQVLFRLPKADSAFEYWTQDGLDHGIENGGALDRTEAGRLNPVDFRASISNSTTGRYFLVGNPFMAHLDMARFLKANSDLLAPKYWIMTAGSQQCAVMTPGSDGFVGTLADASALAPMQGFFVESLAERNSVTVRFTPDMISIRPWTESAGTILKSAPTRAALGADILLTAIGSDGSGSSTALLCVRPDASPGYNAAEDVLLLSSDGITAPLVYTVAGESAASINLTPDAAGTEIGIIATDAAAETTLRFDNVESAGELSLYDTLTGRSEPLYDGMEYYLTGSAAGRLFLTATDAAATDIAPAITIETDGNTVRATAPGAPETTVEVYELTGKRAGAARGYEGTAEVSGLEKGFYIVKATACGRKGGKKVLIR